MDKKIFKNITFDEWEKVGEGGNAESFFHKNDDTKVLKLAKADKRAVDKMFEEIEVTSTAIDMGIKTPKILDYVICEERYGIIYERLVGKNSFGKLCHDNPDKIEEYGKIFARELAELHKIRCDKEKVRSKKQQLIDKISMVKNKKYYDIAMRYIGEMKDVDTVLHGDATLGNLLQVGDKFYWIDIGTMMYGDPAYDIGIMYLSYTYFVKVGFVQNIFHVTEKQANIFYKSFIDEYAKAAGLTLEDIELRAKKAAVVVLIIMTYVEKFSIVGRLFFKIKTRNILRELKCYT